MKKILILYAMLWACFSYGQTIPTPIDMQITQSNKYDNVYTFETINEPALMPKAGAPAPFRSYFWEFGDGHFSFDDQPTHIYAVDPEDANYTSYVSVTNNYSDDDPPPTRPGKPKKKKKKGKVKPVARLVSNLSRRQDIRLTPSRQPKPKDKMVCVMTYKNRLQNMQNGRLYLFYNEHSLGKNSFQVHDVRTHYGEVKAHNPLPKIGYDDTQTMNDLWCSTSSNSAYSTSFNQDKETSGVPLQHGLANYKNVVAYDFNNLASNEERNLFFTLKTTPEMIRDTNATIRLYAVYKPNDESGIDAFELDMLVQTSYDPNRLIVSDRKVDKKDKNARLTYTIEFQNYGKAAASNIRIETLLDKGIDPKTIKIEEVYPVCNSCPKNDSLSTISCLDTIIMKDKIIFDFKRIYLPGKKQSYRPKRDSTKGFVRYSIALKKPVRRRNIKAQASIHFDKNEPIRTNRVRTRCLSSRMGLRFGLISEPQSNPTNWNFDNFFFNASFTPFQGGGIYVQSELQMSFEQYIHERDTTYYPFGTTANFPVDSIIEDKYKMTYFDVVPAQIRVDITPFFSIGAGVDLNFLLVSNLNDNSTDGLFSKNKKENFSVFVPGFHLDANAGLVKHGPSVGFRYNFRRNKLLPDEGRTWNHRGQVYLQYKF